MSNRESRNVAGTLETDYRMLLEKSIDAIVVVGQDGLIRFVNPAAETILGNEEKELLGESLHFALESGETTEVAIPRSDGETAVAEMRVMEIEWQNESAYFVSLHDITERKQAEKAVRESEGRYKALTDNLNVAVYRNTPGPKGNFMEVNPAHFRMFGYENKEEFLAVDVSDLYQNPEDRIKLSGKLSRLGSAEEELQLKRKDGTPFIGLVSAMAVKDENNEVLYFDGIIEDITERKRAEALLKESEERHRNLVEMAPDGIITIDMKGFITSCNPVALALAGRAKDEIIGKHFTETGSIQVRDIPKYLKMFSAVLEGKAPAPVEYLFVRVDGTTAWAEAHYALVEDGGKAAGVQVILRDITERKRTEELTRIQRDLLQESERKYRLLIETADAAISVISGDGDFLLLNNQAAAQMNGKPDDFMGKNLSDIFSEEALEVPMEEIREVINSQQGHTRENPIRLPVGEKWLSTNIQPIKEQDGSISSVQIISQDITRYKKQEEALLRNLEREDEAFQHGRLEIVDTILHNIGNAMNSVTIGAGTAQKKVSRLTRYLCSLADAIKKNQDNFSHYVEKDPQGQKVAPLIMALADEFGGNDGNLVETVNRVAERAEHVAEIIRTVESVTGKMYSKDIELRKAVEDAITVLKYSIEKRHIEINYNCDRAPGQISVHESQFHQMLVNLIKNSMEAIDDLAETDCTNKTHSIEIRCFTESDSLILEVADDGIGIEESLLAVIFRPGYSTKKGGTGSGLHSIANFVKRCDGHIQALSDGPEKGATIRVILPLVED